MPASDARPEFTTHADAIRALNAYLGDRLDAPMAAPARVEDLSLRHLAKAVATTRSALSLLEAGAWTDACILARAVFEQLFTYLWVVQDASRVEVRATMVTIKQEWANAKYLEGLAARAEEGPDRDTLLREAAGYREVAERLLGELAAQLGTTEKKVRDEASMRASLKAIEVNLGPPFSLPYAYYSSFVHTDGLALAPFGTEGPEGVRYRADGLPATAMPIAGDLHRVLLRLAEEVAMRVPSWQEAALAAYLEAHARWLAAADRGDRS